MGHPGQGVNVVKVQNVSVTLSHLVTPLSKTIVASHSGTIAPASCVIVLNLFSTQR